MPTLYTQAHQPMALYTTTLRRDALLLAGFSGTEAISQPFAFNLSLLAPDPQEIVFDRLLGQNVYIELQTAHPQRPRYFHGICSRLSQGESDRDFTYFQMQLVPALWLLTLKVRSRVFNQQLNVPDLLKKILREEWQLDVVGFDTLMGPFEPRDYLVQYRESDFNFVSRLMEEEGIYYFFRHSSHGHQMVLANSPLGHPDMPDHSAIVYRDGDEEDFDAIYDWTKVQQMCSSKYTLWDHCFELPDSHLEAERPVQDQVPVGEVVHRLPVGNNGQLEMYDYPGMYAQRFDGVDKGGGDQPEELAKIYLDNQRTVGIRMQEEAASSLTIRGASRCRHLVSGHRFILERHPHANGSYVVTRIKHTASNPAYRTGSSREFSYRNSFRCIPYDLPFRPQRITAKPVIAGTQTAVVVGRGEGEEICVDKHGRVKVQFHWDREGKYNLDSSCWVRVAQSWAGKTYGTFFWPRVGHEVVVAFEEGDPDRPIIIGSVYNAENVVGAPLPDNDLLSGLFTLSSPGGTEDEYNELSFWDERGDEEVYLRAQKDFVRDVFDDELVWIGSDRKVEIEDDDHLYVGDKQFVEIKNGQQVTIPHGNSVMEVKDGNVNIFAKKMAVLQGGQTAALQCGTGTFVAAYKEGVWIKGSMAVLIEAPMVTIKAPLIVLDAGVVQVTGIVSCAGLMTNSVISPSYTPGFGNIM